MTSSNDPAIKRAPLGPEDQVSLSHAKIAAPDKEEHGGKPELSSTSFKFDVERPKDAPESERERGAEVAPPRLDSGSSPDEPAVRHGEPAPAEKNEEISRDIITRMLAWFALLLRRLERFILGARRAEAAPSQPQAIIKKKKAGAGKEDEEEDSPEEGPKLLSPDEKEALEKGERHKPLVGPESDRPKQEDPLEREQLPHRE